MTTLIAAPVRTVRIRDIADSIQYGHTASAVSSPNGPRFLRITDIQDGQVDWSSVPSCDIDPPDIAKYSLKTGDLVFARTGATTDKSYLIRESPEAVFASYLIRVRVTEDAIDSRYLAAFFQSPDYWQQIEGGKRGIGQPNVNASILGDIVLPLPSLEEQRKIVEEIETQLSRLEAGVVGLRRAQASLKRYRAATLKAACEGRLVPTEAELARAEGRDYETGAGLLARILAERWASWSGRGKYQEPQRLSPPELPDLPEGWAWMSLEQASSGAVGSIQSGPFGSQLLHSEFTSEGVLAIGIDNVRDGWFSIGRNHRISVEKYAELEKFTARPNDVLVTVMATIGRVCGLPEDLEPAIVTKHCYRVSPALQGVSPKFLAFCLQADSPTRWHLFGNVRGQTRPGLNGSILKAAPVPLPPLAEQARIVAEVERRLSVVGSLEAAVKANLHRATRLRQSVL